MSVKIKNCYRGPFSSRIERVTQLLLNAVPQEHLAGLDAIFLVDQVTHKASRERKAGGLYRQKWQHRTATIELAPRVIYRGAPRLVFHLPFLAQFALANVLYHEIGHHYQLQLTHGVTKEEREAFADEYRGKMLRQVFSGWLRIILPIWRLVRWLKRPRTRAVP